VLAIQIKTFLPVFEGNFGCNGESILKVTKLYHDLTVLLEVARDKVEASSLLQSVFLLGESSTEQAHWIGVEQALRLL